MTAVYVVKHESGDTGVKGRLGGVANYWWLNADACRPANL